MSKVIALCQCVKCLRYLTRDRIPTSDNPHDHQCIECYPGNGGLAFRPPGIPLAKVRGPLTDPLAVEVTALVSEECGETVQRIGKIQRWGWDADFAGTTQQHKLEVELGDILAAILVAAHNGQVSMCEVVHAANKKLDKFREDAAGPRQRLTVAAVPDGTAAYLLAEDALSHASREEQDLIYRYLQSLTEF